MMTVGDPSRVDGWWRAHLPRSSCGMTGGYGEVKPPASTPARKLRVPSCEPALLPSRGSRRRPWPSYRPCCPYLRMLQKSIGNSDGSPIKPDSNHHKHKKTKVFGLEVSVTDQAG
ncbi:hypothetical protein [Segatella baroniae]|uniref:hypothetical protein n=1 Tax=Segatella baroniae TaxID=305719 RepID=UPI0012DDA58A|nr:hypothetical protein [Segatella baroniae]